VAGQKYSPKGDFAQRPPLSRRERLTTALILLIPGLAVAIRRGLLSN
jgi:hypothetical protein